MRTAKLIIYIILMGNLMGCKSKRNEVKIADYYEVFENKDIFYQKRGTDFDVFKKNNFLNAGLIKCNMPFKFADNYELAILFNNKLVYLDSDSNNIKLPESFKEGDIINVSVLFISDESVYKLINKYTFSLKKDIKYYYLTFLPYNDTDQFIMIPSDEYIS